jgi:predicted RNA binding protein YcfA (HicA-like mRNA interferase family)
VKHELKQLVRQAEVAGWQVLRTRSGHWRLTHPSGAIVFAPSTPSCSRSVRNLAADLRRVERRIAG